MQKNILNIEKIIELLPHRYPMLLIDKLKIISDKSAIGYKNVSFNEPHFQGHFPGAPIMPGVMIIEAMAQAAGALVAYNMKEETKDNLVYFTSIEDAKFRKPVVPGDVLELHVDSIQNRKMIHKFKGVAKVNDQLVTEAIYTAMMVNKSDHSNKVKK